MTAVMEVKRYEPNPEQGRPVIASFMCPQGGLYVHVDRESQALVMYAVGPAGGERGRMYFPTARAGDVRDWCVGGGAALLGRTEAYMKIKGDVGAQRLHINRVGHSRGLTLPLPMEARDALMECLGAWAKAAGAGNTALSLARDALEANDRNPTKALRWALEACLEEFDDHSPADTLLVLQSAVILARERTQE